MSAQGLMPVERRETYSPAGLRLVDELTGGVPIGRTTAALDILDANGNWRPTNIKAVRTPSGAVTYPGLERHADLTGLTFRRYRVRIWAEFYRPLYRALADGFEFKAFAFNDANPPATTAQLPQDLLLSPAPGYPFPAHVPTLRGIVVDVNGVGVQDAVVTQGVRERVLTDDRGAYALPLRWVAEGVQTPIDATDQRTGRVGTIQIVLPTALGTNQRIKIQ